MRDERVSVFPASMSAGVFLQLEPAPVGVRASGPDERGNQVAVRQTGAARPEVCCSQLKDDPARNIKHKQNLPCLPS